MESGLFSKGSSGHSIRTVGSSHSSRSVGSSHSGYVRGIGLVCHNQSMERKLKKIRRENE